MGGEQPGHGRNRVRQRRRRGKDFRQGQDRDPENHVRALRCGRLGGGQGRGRVCGRAFHWPLHDRPEMDAAGGFCGVCAGGRHRGRGAVQC